MGAALNMDTDDEAVKYAIDDKVAKIKEHWETVALKVQAHIDSLERMNGKLVGGFWH